MKNKEEAYLLLDELNAPKKLIIHVQLVWEAGKILCAKMKELNISIDYLLVEVGIAIHDIGKIVHRSEIVESGILHEKEGEKILLARGYSAKLAKVCVSHGQWKNEDNSLEELLIALSDKLWKGKRVVELETMVINRIASILDVEYWSTFTELDDCFEGIAADGDLRLNRSVTSTP